MGSLIEIAITVVVMSIGILTTFVLLSSSHKEMATSREYIAATAVAAELVDRVRLVSYRRLEATRGLVDAGGLAWLDGLSPADGLPGVTRRVSVEAREGSKTVDIEVSWETKGKEVRDARGSCRFFIVRTPFF